eukprot:m.13747 g.13747  ORF g.13747 m.13747 type:complete len:505 (-) comp4192_c0_seq1:61-1575(-)
MSLHLLLILFATLVGGGGWLCDDDANVLVHALPDNTETCKLVDRWSEFTASDEVKSRLQPQLLGIGVQKGGTTSLHRYVHHMTFIEPSKTKELHYFDFKKTVPAMMEEIEDNMNLLRLAEMTGKGLITGNHSTIDEWLKNKKAVHGISSSKYWKPFVRQNAFLLYKLYLSNWKDAYSRTKCNEEKMTCHIDEKYERVGFEITPGYISNRYSPYAIRYSVPHWDKLKFLLILRNPAQRVFSGLYQMHEDVPMEKMEAIVTKEIDALKKCYEETMALKHLDTCKFAHFQYVDMHTCLTKYSLLSKKTPWFSANYYGWSTIQASADRRSLYDGHVMRGIYVDQIVNYLCAGFSPEQFIVVTSEELKEQHLQVMDRAMAALGREVDVIPGHEKVMERVRHLNRRAMGRYGSDAIQDKLDEFFRPFNAQLIQLLMSQKFNVNMEYIVKEFGPHKHQNDEDREASDDGDADDDADEDDVNDDDNDDEGGDDDEDDHDDDDDNDNDNDDHA